MKAVEPVVAVKVKQYQIQDKKKLLVERYLHAIGGSEEAIEVVSMDKVICLHLHRTMTGTQVTYKPNPLRKENNFATWGFLLAEQRDQKAVYSGAFNFVFYWIFSL